MIVSNGGNLSFRNGFRQCQSQGDVHRYGKDIFSNKKVYVEVINEFMEVNFQQRS